MGGEKSNVSVKTIEWHSDLCLYTIGAERESPKRNIKSLIEKRLNGSNGKKDLTFRTAGNKRILLENTIILKYQMSD